MQALFNAKQIPHFVRASLFTFILLCIVVLAIFMLVLGLFFQIGAWVAPWLLTEGWNLLKFTFALLGSFRVCVVLLRLIRIQHRRLKEHPNYQTFLVLTRGTLRYLLQKIIWVLLQ